MTVKKIIPCLDIKDGQVVKGVNFVNLEKIGQPETLAKFYDQNGADELVFLDISKTEDGHDLLLDLIKSTAEEIKIPLTVGGGIQTLEDIEKILKAGADKVSINSAAVSNPEFIQKAVEQFTSEKIVIAVDMKFDENNKDYYVYTHGGNKKVDIKALDWLVKCERLGCGSLLITSLDHDGVKEGFDLPFLKEAADTVSIPIIASGGAGKTEDFLELFTKTKVAAGLAASIFHRKEVDIKDLKNTLSKNGIEVSK